MKRFSMRAFVLLFACLMGLAICRADELAAVTGLVTDPNGRSVPGVTVIITNLATNLASRTVTNDQGIYRVPSLQPGIYRMSLDKDGFKSIVKSGVELHVQDVASINFELQIGSVNETVTVEAGGLVINTTDGTVSTVIDREFVSQLPLNGRSFNTLLQLTPGVVIAPPSSPNNELGQFNINGQRNDANYFSVDGVGANFGTSFNGFSGQAGGGVVPAFNAAGGTSSLVSVDAMQEFRIQTSTFAPEYGHQPGGQIAIETRSGTNEFHGAAFDYLRNTVLDANDWFNNATAKPRSPDIQNDFGGVLGGPVMIPGAYNGHDKTFFFFSYEGLRLRQPQTAVITVPSVALRTSSSTLPAAMPYLNAFPLPDPNSPDLGNGLAQFTGGWSNQITSDTTSVRIDHRFGPKWNIFGRFNNSPSQTVNRAASLSDIITTALNTRSATVGLNGTFRGNITNSFRANYSEQSGSNTATIDSFGGAIPPPSNFLFPAPRIPSTSSANFLLFDTGIYEDGFQGRSRSTQVNVLDDLAVNLGSHLLKFGVDERAHWQRSPEAAGLDYFVSSAQNLASTATADFGIFSGVTPAFGLLSHAFSLYAQDTWKVARRLTLTYGFRWELDPAPSALGSTILSSWENVDNPASMVLAPVGTPPWKTTYGDFALRLGIAYRLTSSGDLVLRGGAGSYYDTPFGVEGNVLSFIDAGNKFDVTPSDLTLPRPNMNGLVPPTATGQPPYQSSSFGAVSPNLQLPRSYQWNVSVEKSFDSKQAFSVTYVGQIGRRLLRTQETLTPPSNPNFSPGSLFFLANNGDTSDYQALQLQYRRPLTKRLQALANYTWGHSIDTNSSDVSFNGSDQIVSPGATRGSSSYDVRQNFTGAFTYDFPGTQGREPIKFVTKGWSVSLIGQARTGFPIDIVTSQLAVLGYEGTSRPDLVPGQPIWLDDSTKPGGKRLNRAAFVVPSTPRQGDLGRNSIRGFGMTQIDLSVARAFSFTERWKLQFRGDMFNLFNHPNFANPDNALSDGSFGVSNRMLNQGLGGLNALYQVGGPRSIQLSLKLLF